MQKLGNKILAMRLTLGLTLLAFVVATSWGNWLDATGKLNPGIENPVELRISGLDIELEILEQGVLPEFPLWVQYRITNGSSEPIEIPVRLSITNGTLSFRITDPSGQQYEPFAQRCFVSGEVDLLEPDQSINGLIAIPTGQRSGFMLFDQGEYTMYLQLNTPSASFEGSSVLIVDHHDLVISASAPGTERVRQVINGGGTARLISRPRIHGEDQGSTNTLADAFQSYWRGLALAEISRGDCESEPDPEGLLNAGMNLNEAGEMTVDMAPNLAAASYLALAQTRLDLGDVKGAEELVDIARNNPLPFFSSAVANAAAETTTPWLEAYETPGVSLGVELPETTDELPMPLHTILGYSLRAQTDALSDYPEDYLRAYLETVAAEPTVPNDNNLDGNQEQGTFNTPWGKVTLWYQRVDEEVYAGDMGLDPSSLLSASDPTSHPSRRTATISNWDGLWPLGIIPYEVNPYDATLAKAVQEAVKDYESKTLLRFVKFNASLHHDGHLIFKTGSVPGKGNSDWLGRNASKPNTITMKDSAKDETGVVVHEIGHAIGLFHEHQRKDRNAYVSIKQHNVDLDAKGFNNNFAIYGGWSGLTSGPYDFGSIMHYGSDAFIKNEFMFWACEYTPFTVFCDPSDFASIVKKNNDVIDAQRGGLSADDAKGINQLYANAQYCGGILPGGPQLIQVNPSSFKAKKIIVKRCNKHNYWFQTANYYDLVIDVTSSEKLGPNFVARIITPDDTQQPASFELQKITDYHQRLIRKGTQPQNWDGLLPGRQEIQLFNWHNKTIPIEITITLTPSAIPPDGAENNNTLATAYKIPSSGLQSPLINYIAQLATLHHGDDLDFFEIQLPSDDLKAQCKPAQTVTGPTGAVILPAYVAVFLDIKHGGARPMLVSIFDEAGHNIHSDTFTDGNWKTKQITFKCPYNLKHDGHLAFPSGRLRLSVRSPSKKLGIYSVAARYAPTAENIPPKELPDLRVLPGPVNLPHRVMFRIPLTDFLVDPRDFIGQPGQLAGQESEFIGAQTDKLRAFTMR